MIIFLNWLEKSALPKIFLEVYDTDSPVEEVRQLNYYYGHWNKSHD